MKLFPPAPSVSFNMIGVWSVWLPGPSLSLCPRGGGVIDSSGAIGRIHWVAIATLYVGNDLSVKHGHFQIGAASAPGPWR